MLLFFKKFHGSNALGCALFVSGNFSIYNTGIGIRKCDFLLCFPQHYLVIVAIFLLISNKVYSLCLLLSFNYSYWRMSSSSFTLTSAWKSFNKYLIFAFITLLISSDLKNWNGIQYFFFDCLELLIFQSSNRTESMS